MHERHRPLAACAAALLIASTFAVILVAGPVGAQTEPVTGSGVVNVIEAEGRKLNITHGPIPALGWPGMTMDFAIAETVSLEGIEVGSKVTFTLRKTAGGMYVIESLNRAAE